MADLTTSGANDAVDAVAAVATHVALFTADPTATGSMANEVANSNGYSRQAVTWTTTSSASESNSAAVEFAASGGDWGTVTHVGLVTSGTHGAGVVKTAKALTASRDMTDGSTLTFAIGALVLQAGVIT